MAVLVVDNLSPFTTDILTCLGQLDQPHLHKRFSQVSNEDLAQCDRVILSGRRKHSKEINAVNSRIIRYCHDRDKPLLGICYGAEIIALTLGGSIRKMPAHVQGITEVSFSSANPLDDGKESILVYESHRYCIAKLPLNFKSLASSKYCEHEVFSNGSKMYGTQFHPEKSGNDGLALLKNFLTT
ncbi:MAG: gamma-glutamyl-gamma-aminobutyrate hydrolase family protein [Thermoproteota archaeon]|nr:gamma-glutamyl-gamma-aminobutyrate hydrolase family protein [Thermoproteota archaeon]